MRIDKESFDILTKSDSPSFFRVNISEDTVFIEEKINDNIYGNVIVCSEEIENAFEIALNYKDTIDYLLFFDKKEKQLHTIARPQEANFTIEQFFEKIKSLSKDFEERKEQIELSKRIQNCLFNKSFGIFEAPTGTGKSLAYLIPAILYAKSNHNKVIISTNTINLQRQLMEKDLPVIKSITNINAKVALGRSNYLCKRKLDYITDKGDIFLFDNDSYEKLKLFAKQSETGLKSELFDSQTNIDENLWENVSSSSLSCIHKKCPYYKNRCFYYKARASLESADLIIANHHIVLSDALMKEAKVLPDYDAIIFDEAHNLEKNATNYFTQTVSTTEILRLLEKLYSKKKNKESGLLSDTAENEEKNKAKEIIKQAKTYIKNILTFFNSIKRDEITITSNNIEKFESVITEFYEILTNVSLALKSRKDNVDISAIAHSLSDNVEILKAFVKEDDQQSVKWIKKTQNYIHFNITPLSIDRALQENVYQNTGSVIFISATISVNNNCVFFKKTVGVENADEFIAKEGFDYASSAKLIIVKDAPIPDSKSYTTMLSNSITDIADIIKQNDIGALVLFTSYKMLKDTYDLTYEKLKKTGINILKQGDFDNFEILKTFKEKRGVLFATSSFWEGIDVKGKALSIVFITRLPFEVPVTPIESAKYEIMKKQGVNAFLEYSLPKAVLKFRQGFGRLIRDKNDKGVIIVSDSRIVHKAYGKMFIESLKRINKEVIKKDEIKNSVCDFFGNC